MSLDIPFQTFFDPVFQTKKYSFTDHRSIDTGERKNNIARISRERERDDDALLLFLANSTKGSSDERVSPEDTSL